MLDETSRVTLEAFADTIVPGNRRSPKTWPWRA